LFVDGSFVTNGRSFSAPVIII